MHDIRWIREQRRRLRPRADAARARAAVARSCMALDETPPRGDHQIRAGAGAAQRGLEGDRRRPRRAKDEATAQQADGRGRRAEDCDARRWRRRRRRSRRSWTRRWRRSRTCRSTTCRTARTRTATSSIITFGAKRDYAFKPKQHFELGEALGLMDFETAAKLSGARFVVLKKGLARHGTRARAVHARCAHEEHGYTEVNPPLLVRDDAMFGDGAVAESSRDDQISATEPN